MKKVVCSSFITITILAFFILPSSLEAAPPFGETEMFSYPDETSPAPGWEVINAQRQDKKYIPIDEISNSDGTKAIWKITDGEYEIHILPQSILTLTQTLPLEWPEGLNDYSVEFDMRLVNSVNYDRNFVFRYVDLNNWYNLHFYNNTIYFQKLVDGKGATEGLTGNLTSTYPFMPNEVYNFKINLTGNKIEVSINNTFQMSITDTSSNPILQGKAGPQSGVGAISRGDVSFDNIKVTSLAPTPTPILLNVPDIKQYSDPWGSLTHDSATPATHGNPSIKRWGCALTSGAMVLNYYGYNVTPGSLNEWLKQNNGFEDNYVIFPAVAKYAETHKFGNSPSLEFKYLLFSDELVDEELKNARPAMIKLAKEITVNGEKKINSHFVVDKGKDNGNFIINDPASTSKTTLSSAVDYYGNAIKVGQFKPSNTDLSYIVLFVGENIDISVSSESGEIVGDQYYFKESPYADPDNPEADTGLETLNAFYYPKPDLGNYTVTLTGSGNYKLDSYLYNSEGEVSVDSLSGTIEENESQVFTLAFNEKTKLIFPQDKEDGFEDLLETWEKGKSDGLIKHARLYIPVRSFLKSAQGQYKKGYIIISKLFLRFAQAKIKRHTPNYINSEFSAIMQEKIKLQLENL